MSIKSQHGGLMLICILVEQRWGRIPMAAVAIVRMAYPAQAQQKELPFEKQEKDF